MLIFIRRLRWLFIVGIAFFFLRIFYAKYRLTDEHRIYTSILEELPHFERLLREKQKNFSDVQYRLNKIERTLSKYTWHLNRLLRTIRFNQDKSIRHSHFNSFDFDFTKNQSKFLVYFHPTTKLSIDIDDEILRQFYSNIRSPYRTFNQTEAVLKIVYLPIRSNQGKLCYKDLFTKDYLIIYEFINEIEEDIDQRCFEGNFLPVKLFHHRELQINDYWRWNEGNRTSIGIIYLNTSASLARVEIDRLKEEYDIQLECNHSSCFKTVVQTNLSAISIICSSSYSISIQYQFFELFYNLLSEQTHLILSNCNGYLPYSKLIDYSHPSTSLPWVYTIYFQTFERRVQTLIAYLRTYSHFPLLPNEIDLIKEPKNQLIKAKNVYYLIHSRNLNFTQMPIGLLTPINFQTNKPFKRSSESTFYDQWNRFYQPFYRSTQLTNPFELHRGTTINEKYTIVILTHKRRFYQLNRLLLHLNGLINVDRILVLFNQIDPLNSSPSENLTLTDFLDNYEHFLPSIHIEIVYLFNLINDLNNRFIPWHEFIQTDGILSLDDDSFLRHDEIEYGFHTWKENRARLVGFISRTHRSNPLEYDATSSCAYSMILTGAAFIHRWYLDYYTNIMSKKIRDYVRLNMNCEDLAMNFLISFLSNQSPIKIGHRETFHCYQCEESLSNKIHHYQQRTECLKYFSNLYRFNPLRYSIYHIDSFFNITSCFSSNE